mgnify:FL=1
MKIKSIKGYELIDSRGNPTVAAKTVLECGAEGLAIVPSGASTGQFEAHELRDGDVNRYNGKGTLNAKNNINEIIAPLLKGINACEQYKIDEKMIKCDNTDNKSRLGANAILAVSLSVARAAANGLSIPLYRYLGGAARPILPVPMMNILNGGAHAANNIDIQEFMIMPIRAKSFSERLRICCEIYHTLGRILKSEGLSSGVGDEGGFAPNLESDTDAVGYLVKAIEKSGYDTGSVKIALDAASSEWYKEGKYILPKRNETMDFRALVEFYEELINKYPVISIEDGLSETDFDGWHYMTERLGSKIQLVGDDLFVTDKKRLKIGIENKAANAILIKPNQIGTLSETLDVIRFAHKNGYKAIVSHRSGDTEDAFIADIAVGMGTGQIKTGAPQRSERTAKYNRLIMTEDEIN